MTRARYSVLFVTILLSVVAAAWVNGNDNPQGGYTIAFIGLTISMIAVVTSRVINEGPNALKKPAASSKENPPEIPTTPPEGFVGHTTEEGGVGWMIGPDGQVPPLPPDGFIPIPSNVRLPCAAPKTREPRTVNFSARITKCPL